MTLILNEWDERLINGRIHHRRTGMTDWQVGRAPANAARINDLDRMTATEVAQRQKNALAQTQEKRLQTAVANDFLLPVFIAAMTPDTTPDTSSDVSGGGGSFDGGGASGDF